MTLMIIPSISAWARRASLGYSSVNVQSWLAQGEKVPVQSMSMIVHRAYRLY